MRLQRKISRLDRFNIAEAVLAELIEEWPANSPDTIHLQEAQRIVWDRWRRIRDEIEP